MPKNKTTKPRNRFRSGLVGPKLSFSKGVVAAVVALVIAVGGFVAVRQSHASGCSVPANNGCTFWNSFQCALDSNHVFYRGSDGQVWHKWYNNNSGWHGDEPLGGQIVGNPAAGTDGCQLHVYARGTDNQIWHKWYTTSWSGWEPLGGQTNYPPGVEYGGKTVWVTGTDGQLYSKTYNGGWSGWSGHGVYASSGPGGAGNALCGVVFRGRNDDNIWLLTGGALYNLGGHTPAGNSAAITASNTGYGGNCELAVRGTNNAIYHGYWNGSWSGWGSIGGGTYDQPAISSQALNGTFDIWVRGTDGHLYHKWWQGGAWHGWESLGSNLASGPGASPF